MAFFSGKPRSPRVDLDAHTGFSSSESSSFAFCCGDASKPCERGDINAAIRCLSERNERIAAHLEMRQPRTVSIRRGDSLVRSLRAELELCDRLDLEAATAKPAASAAHATAVGAPVPTSSSPVKRLQSPPPPDLSVITNLSVMPTQPQRPPQLVRPVVVEEIVEPSDSDSSSGAADNLCSISRAWKKLKDLTIASPPPRPHSQLAVEGDGTVAPEMIANTALPGSAAEASASPASASARSIFFTSDDSKAASVASHPSAPGAVPDSANRPTHNEHRSVNSKTQPVSDSDDSADEKFEEFLKQQRQQLKPVSSESDSEPHAEGQSRHGDDSFIVPDASVDSEDDDEDQDHSDNARPSGQSLSVSASSGSDCEKQDDDDDKENSSPAPPRPVKAFTSGSSSTDIRPPRPRRQIRLSTIFTSESSSSSSSSSSEEEFTPAAKPAFVVAALTQPKSRPPPQLVPRSATATVSAATPSSTSLTPLQRRRRREAIAWSPLAVSPVRHADFLASLDEEMPDEKRHPDALQFVHKFRQKRDQLAQYLVRLFNHSAFDGLLPSDLVVTWNRRLTTTAGYCRYQRRRVSDYCIGSDDNDADRNNANQPVTSVGITRTCRIELSVKVCDSASRTRDTLVHELCHAACWLINGANDGHGRLWKAWTAKCARAHPSLPPIRRCHAYVVEKKFLYKCTACGYSLARHSRSVRGGPAGNVCPRCRQGQFECHVNTPAGRKRLSQALRPPTPFAQFVKDHYGTVRSARKSLNHAGVMRELSNRFRQVQQPQQQRQHEQAL